MSWQSTLTVLVEDRRGDEELEDAAVPLEGADHLAPHQELTDMLRQLPQFLRRQTTAQFTPLYYFQMYEFAHARGTGDSEFEKHGINEQVGVILSISRMTTGRLWTLGNLTQYLCRLNSFNLAGVRKSLLII